MNLKLTNPINWREKKIIIMPAIILNILELFKKNVPRKVAVEPKLINTIENPKLKKIVFVSIK